MVARSKYKEWFDCDKGDIYPSEGRYVTNKLQLLVLMISDACMMINDLFLGFSLEDIGEVVHLKCLRVQRGWTKQWWFSSSD